MSPRVALVNDVAGVARLEAEALRGAGWPVDFYDLPKPGARWPWLLKAFVIPIRLLLSLPVVWRLRRGQYDVVHVHFLSQGFVGAASGRPYFLHAHGSDLHLNLGRRGLSSWTRRWLRGARGIFYVTPNLRALLSGFTAKATLMPNPVDTARFAAIEPPAALRRVLVFMRLDDVKGAPKVFQHIEAIAGQVEVSAMLWGPLARDYSTRYGRWVQFLEPVSPSAVPVLLERFDAVIGQMAQGVLGLSELEAMAAARPVLVRLDHSLIEGESPPVVDVGNAGALAARLERLKADPDELRRIASAGRAWVEAHHSLRVHAELLIRAYTSVADDRA